MNVFWSPNVQLHFGLFNFCNYSVLAFKPRLPLFTALGQSRLTLGSKLITTAKYMIHPIDILSPGLQDINVRYW